jgi:hypothetical protein
MNNASLSISVSLVCGSHGEDGKWWLCYQLVSRHARVISMKAEVFQVIQMQEQVVDPTSSGSGYALIAYIRLHVHCYGTTLMEYI